MSIDHRYLDFDLDAADCGRQIKNARFRGFDEEYDEGLDRKARSKSRKRARKVIRSAKFAEVYSQAA